MVICPLTKDECSESKCAWWVVLKNEREEKTGRCSVAWAAIISKAMTTMSKNVAITFGFHTDIMIDLRVLRGATQIWDTPTGKSVAAANYFCFQIVDEAPGTGDITYYLQGRVTGGVADANVTARSLTCIEFRK